MRKANEQSSNPIFEGSSTEKGILYFFKLKSRGRPHDLTDQLTRVLNEFSIAFNGIHCSQKSTVTENHRKKLGGRFTI